MKDSLQNIQSLTEDCFLKTSEERSNDIISYVYDKQSEGSNEILKRIETTIVGDYQTKDKEVNKKGKNDPKEILSEIGVLVKCALNNTESIPQ